MERGGATYNRMELVIGATDERAKVHTECNQIFNVVAGPGR
jgi:hypothetical protein